MERQNPASSPSESSPRRNLENLLAAPNEAALQEQLEKLYPASELESLHLPDGPVKMHATRVRRK